MRNSNARFDGTQLALGLPVGPRARKATPAQIANTGLCRDCGERPRLEMWSTCLVCWRANRRRLSPTLDAAEIAA
jgi:hypothetical protein